MKHFDFFSFPSVFIQIILLIGHATFFVENRLAINRLKLTS